MQKITPFLWFDNNAEEAMNFYVSVFKDAEINSVNRYTAEAASVSGRSEGTVITATFRLFGQEFVIINGGPMFKFTEAVSFVINCDDQAEVDYYWDKLSDGGEIQMCGWLKDRFGLSWQVVPRALPALLKGKDASSAQRVMHAMMQMKKLDLPTLEKAYEG